MADIQLLIGQSSTEGGTEKERAYAFTAPETSPIRRWASEDAKKRPRPHASGITA